MIGSKDMPETKVIFYKEDDGTVPLSPQRDDATIGLIVFHQKQRQSVGFGLNVSRNLGMNFAVPRKLLNGKQNLYRIPKNRKPLGVGELW